MMMTKKLWLKEEKSGLNSSRVLMEFWCRSSHNFEPFVVVDLFHEETPENFVRATSAIDRVVAQRKHNISWWLAQLRWWFRSWCPRFWRSKRSTLPLQGKLRCKVMSQPSKAQGDSFFSATFQPKDIRKMSNSKSWSMQKPSKRASQLKMEI